MAENYLQAYHAARAAMLHEAREAAGITREELAGRMGISAQKLCRMEEGLAWTKRTEALRIMYEALPGLRADIKHCYQRAYGHSEDGHFTRKKYRMNHREQIAETERRSISPSTFRRIIRSVFCIAATARSRTANSLSSRTGFIR